MELGWRTIEELIDNESKTMVFKSLNDLAPQYLCNLFSRNSACASRNLRNTETDFFIDFLKPFREDAVLDSAGRLFHSLAPRKEKHFCPFAEVFFGNLNKVAKENFSKWPKMLLFPGSKTSANGQKCFSFRGAKLWNSLPAESKTASSLNGFKKSIKG